MTDPTPEVPAALTPAQKRKWAEQQAEGEYEPEPGNPSRIDGPLFMDGLDAAIIGVGRQYTKPLLIVYDYDLIVKTLTEKGMSEDEVVEYVSVNILDAWVGEFTPFILNMPSVDD
jgi:hypothetical protein